MAWRRGHQSDRAALALADRHYSRTTPGSPKFMPPGRAVVLVDDAAPALWACSWPKPELVRRAYPRSWFCTVFRREGGLPASAMILEAIGLTRGIWGEPPEDGLVSIIDPTKVKPTKVRGKDVWGWTWLKAGFEPAGNAKKKRHLMIFRLPPERFPAAVALETHQLAS